MTTLEIVLIPTDILLICLFIAYFDWIRNHK